MIDRFGGCELFSALDCVRGVGDEVRSGGVVADGMDGCKSKGESWQQLRWEVSRPGRGGQPEKQVLPSTQNRRRLT